MPSRNLVQALVLAIPLTWSSMSFGTCVDKWDKLGDLKDTLKGIDISRVQSSGQVQFNLQGAKGSYILKNNGNSILAKTPDGSAKVKLCVIGDVLHATANLGPFGKRTAQITDLGGGSFGIATSKNTYKASVVK